MNIDELDAICEGCERECPDGFCKAYRNARYKLRDMRFVKGHRLMGMYQGRWISIDEGVKIAGCTKTAIYHRLESGMTFTDAIKAGGNKKGYFRYITHNGKTMCIRDWCNTLGIKYMTLYKHIVIKGRTMDEALKRIKKRRCCND